MLPAAEKRRAARDVRARRNRTVTQITTYASPGFTLLELLIVVVVLGLAYAIAGPAVGKARVQAAVQNSKYGVVSAVSLARATAVRFGRPAVLRLDAASDRLWIEVDTTLAGSGVVDTLGYFSFGDELRVDLQSDRASLCFDGRGIGMTSTECPQAGAVIIVTLGGRADTVSVSALGRVSTS